MYAFVQKNGHVVWREWWYPFMLGFSLRANFYMIHEDRIFVAGVVVIELTWEMMVANVIN
jgi:hypothetical protein